MKSLPVVQPVPDPVDLPAPTAEATAVVADAARTEALKPAILDAIRTVFDPEIPVNIMELGLVYDVWVDAAGVAGIRMTLTAPGCPVAGDMPSWVENAVSSVPGVGQVKVNLVFDPPWDPSRMSEEARLALNMF